MISLNMESFVAILCPTALAIILTHAKIIGSTEAGLRLESKKDAELHTETRWPKKKLTSKVAHKHKGNDLICIAIMALRLNVCLVFQTYKSRRVDINGNDFKVTSNAFLRRSHQKNKPESTKIDY